MGKVPRIIVCALAIGLVPTVAACGSGDTVSVTPPSSGVSGVSTAGVDTDSPVPDAKTLADDARSAYRSAKTAHVHATIDEDGQEQTVDIRGSMDGTNQELTVKDPDGGDATLRTVDKKYYIKGNQDFWQTSTKADSTSAALLADKWVLAPQRSTTPNSISRLTIRSLLDSMIGDSALSDSDLADMRTSRESDGDKQLYVAEGDDPAADVNTFKVLADGSNNVAEITGATDDGDDGTAAFDGWNTQARVGVPKGYITLPNSSGSGSTDRPGRDT